MMTTVLVIDDDRSTLRLVSKVLRAREFEVLEAPNGEVGVELARTHLPQLIISDVEMPVLDGFGVLEKLRTTEETSTIPFIFLTCRTDGQDMRQGMNLGADDYLTKPFEISGLLAAVNTRLAKQAQRVQHAQRQLDDLRRNIAYALPHEFRTPLALLLGYSQLLVEDYSEKDPNLAHIARAIQDSSDRLYRLTEKFWAFTETEIWMADAEAIELLRHQVSENPAEVIRRIGEAIATIYKRDSDLVMDLRNASVQMSDDNLARVLQEVIENAFKFSTPGSPISVVAFMENRTFKIHVTDQGRGMSLEQVQQIGAYNQFGRSDYQQQGTGLGLVIAQRIVRLHGGSIHIESIPNQQTMVTITLPAVPMPVGVG
jgi:two-component system, sensor histidine kinase and response regulator